MQVNIYEDYETLSNHAAREIVRLIKEKDDAVLCLAAGNTPQRTYELLLCFHQGRPRVHSD